ncbi:MAG: hypothetical protein NHB15_16820 [Methanosarcina barkeri]|nr:hypothetical protein [Methanosarcina sp. ERenArc_MAG2]
MKAEAKLLDFLKSSQFTGLTEDHFNLIKSSLDAFFERQIGQGAYI